MPDSPGRWREVILKKYAVTHVVERGRLDRIHPQVRQGLTVVMKAGTVTLYEVPPLP